MVMFGFFSNRPPENITKVSDAGIKFIGDFEGLFRFGGSARFAPRGTLLVRENRNLIYEYIDPIGLPTIGYGHLLTATEKSSGIIRLNGVSVNYRNGLTMQQVIDLKKQDLARFETFVVNNVKVKLTQTMFDALVSFAFNVGNGNLQKSTLLRVLNRGEYTAASNEFIKWNRAGGQVMAGLTRRREAERRMFLSELSKVQ
jgi:lysozyme